MTKYLVSSLLLMTMACSEDNESQKESFTDFYNGKAVDVFSASNLNLINQVYLAESRLLNHMDSLFVTASGQFILEDVEHKAHLEVFSYSSRDELNGSFLRITLNENNPSSMDISLFTGDNVSVLLCTVQNAVAQNGVFDLAIQFDNFLSGGRVSVWNRFISPQGIVNLNFDLFNLSTASCTTQGRTSINQLGFGNRWGVISNYVKVYDVKRESPYEL